MASSFGHQSMTSPDKAVITPRPVPAKATLDDKTCGERLSGLVIEAAKVTYGKQGAAAAQLGKDEGNFSRDAKAKRLTIGHLEELGPKYLAELGRELLEEYGTALESPQARASRVIREMRQKLDEVDEFLRFIA